MSGSTSPEEGSYGSAVSERSARNGIHAAVNEAVDYMWNNRYKEAADVLVKKKNTQPRYALEWANMNIVKTLMSSTSQDHEMWLNLLKDADGLATACKYNPPMFSDSDSSDDDDNDDDDNDDDNNDDSYSNNNNSKNNIASDADASVNNSRNNHSNTSSNNRDADSTSYGSGTHSESRSYQVSRQSNNSNNNSHASNSQGITAKAAAKAAAKQRKKNKKEFKARKKLAKKRGVAFDQAWQLECDVVYADALLLRAITQLMMNSYLKGGINLRKAWGVYYSLIQTVEKDVNDTIPQELKMCIKYGTGTFYAFLTLVPANLMKLLSIIGFISDKNLGEQYLTEVFESDTVRSPFAALVLCTFYLFLPTGLGNVEDTLAKAKHVLDVMNKRYPNNTYFHGYANFYYRKKGETEAAVQEITQSAANAEKAGLVPLLIKYLYADTLFMDQQWTNALTQYENLINYLQRTNEKFAYTGQVTLSIAACYVMLGRNAEAMTWMKKVSSNYNTKSKTDANAPKYAARVLANPKLLPLSGVYMLYLNRDLAHMKKEQGQRILTELQRVSQGADLSGAEATNLYYLFVGVIRKGCGETKEAINYLQKILNDERNIPQELMILPFTYYEMGEIEFKQGHYERARDLFERGRKIRGDGNETLANRYSIAIKQLKQKMDG